MISCSNSHIFVKNSNVMIYMKKTLLLVLCCATVLIMCSYDSEVINHSENPMISIQAYGVLPSNPPELNKRRLQKAINDASPKGLALYVEPCENGYKIDGGIILKKNVSLVGAHGPTGRGTSNNKSNGPAGSVFVITDKNNPFITVESATRIEGIQFYYPEQTTTDPAKIIKYPATIEVSKTTISQGVTLRDLTFYGEYFAMNFEANPKHVCEQLLFENCYGYSLGGKFISIDYCYDIPRIINCHINPDNMRLFGHRFNSKIVGEVLKEKTFAYTINHTDNAQLIGDFTFGTYGGAFLGAATYGQMTNFNYDCVTVGIFKDGNNDFNRNWQISQGAIIANAGDNLSEIHPFVITGSGHTAITNVDAFSGVNNAVPNLGKSNDFMLIQGDGHPTISIVGCRMRNYESTFPVTIKNSKAKVQMVSCVDKDENFVNISL